MTWRGGPVAHRRASRAPSVANADRDCHRKPRYDRPQFRQNCPDLGTSAMTGDKRMRLSFLNRTSGMKSIKPVSVALSACLVLALLGSSAYAQLTSASSNGQTV